MRDFSPFVTFPGLKCQPGVMVRVLSQRSCDYMVKVSAQFAGLKLQPAYFKRAGIFSSNKLPI